MAAEQAAVRATEVRKGRSSEAGNATEKTLRLLEAACAPDGPHRLGEIAAAAGVPKASAHRILQVMVGASFLVTEGSGTYAPGPRAQALAAGVGAATTDGGIDAALDALQRLTGNTVHLALRSGDCLTYTHKVQSAQPVQMASKIGMQMPMHSTAIGKCVLAALDEAELDEFVARTGLPAHTGNTLTDVADLRRDLERVRHKGFAVDDEENEATIRCLGAPLRNASGTVIGGVSVSTVTFLVPRRQLLEWAEAVRDAAESISGRLR